MFNPKFVSLSLAATNHDYFLSKCALTYGYDCCIAHFVKSDLSNTSKRIFEESFQENFEEEDFAF